MEEISRAIGRLEAGQQAIHADQQVIRSDLHEIKRGLEDLQKTRWKRAGFIAGVSLVVSGLVSVVYAALFGR